MHQPSQTTALAVIGVPSNLGANTLGTTLGPTEFRRHEIVEKLTSTGLVVTDFGDVACKPREEAQLGDNSQLRYRDEIIAQANQTGQLVQQALQQNSHPVVLGGDHSIHLGAFAGAAASVQGSVGLIYFDAHGDMNTDQTSPTGNIHGMQVAALMGLGDAGLVNAVAPGQKLKPEHLLHIAGSDFDQAEHDLIARHNIRTFTMLDMIKHGFAPLFPMIDELRAKVDYLWVSIDLDSIDEQYAPAASMPNKKGLLYREITALTEYIGQTCDILGADVVEFDPSKDVDGKTAELGIELISQLFGANYNSYYDHLRRNRVRLGGATAS